MSEAQRRPLPGDRVGKTMAFKILEHVSEGLEREVKGYIQTGEYPDGQLGEVFIKVGKPGNSYASYDDWATTLSIAIQYGVPLEVLLSKVTFRQYEPSGRVVGVPGILKCTSPIDLTARWLLARYGSKENNHEG